MRIARTVLAAVFLMGAGVSAQVAPPATTAPLPQTGQQPPSAPPPQPPAAGAPPVVPAPVVPVAPAAARMFMAPTGMIFNAVRPERVVDFELVIGYLQAAFAKSTNPQVRAQSQGWRMFKATEPGPNNTVLYVFLLDPTVASADYALGPILSDAYPDQIEQIWKLYQGALAGAGSQSLLNLTPVQPPPLPTPGAPPSTTPAPQTDPAPTVGPAARPAVTPVVP